jgi:hypothetical protein
MSNLFPTILMLLALIGGVVMGRMEAQWIVADKKVNHFLLTLLRLSLATLALIALLPRPIEIPTAVMSLLLMMGAFAPTHRVALNSHRMELGHKIPGYHLGRGFYDTCWMIVMGKNERRAFIAMCSFEILLSLAMLQQLRNN